jgi:hypothetical protein
MGRGDNPVQRLSYRVWQGTDANGQPIYGDPRAYEARGNENMGTGIQALLDDPEAKRLLAAAQSGASKGSLDAFKKRAEALGVRLPDGAAFALDGQGNIGYQRRDIVGDYVYPLATLAAGGIISGGLLSGVGGGAGSSGYISTSQGANAGMVGGQSAATGGGIGSAGMGSSLGGATFVPAGGGAGAAGGGAAGGAAVGGGAAAGGGAATYAGMTIPQWIGVAGTVAGPIVQAYSANKAVKAQTEAADKALQFQREVLEQQQRNQQPYMTAGQMSLSRLNSMLSRPGDPQIPMPGPGGKPQGDIMVIAPTGQQMLRPSSERDHWIQRGATIQEAGAQGSPKIPMSPVGMASVPRRSLAGMNQGVR